MADATVAPPQERSTPPEAAASASLRFDWTISILSIWLVAGFYLDLWAHAHGMVDDTFLTPWHAILYAGAVTFGLTLGVPAVRHLVRGAPWRRALPGPYMASLVGLIGFLFAGQLDFVWHSIFGFEVDVAAMLSPPHLALAVTGVVALSGPVRSVWSRPVSLPAWRTHGPAVIGLIAILSVFAALTQYAHPFVDPLAEVAAGDDGSARPPLSQLYAMAADGTGQHRIAVTDTDERNPRLSPDGRVLAFSAFASMARRRSLSPSPTARTTRRSPPRASNARPAWSPDGSRIAFHSDRAARWTSTRWRRTAPTSRRSRPIPRPSTARRGPRTDRGSPSPPIATARPRSTSRTWTDRRSCGSPPTAAPIRPGRPTGRGSPTPRRAPTAMPSRHRVGRGRRERPATAHRFRRRQRPAGLVARRHVDRVHDEPRRRSRGLRDGRRWLRSAEPDAQPRRGGRLVRTVLVARRPLDPLPEPGHDPGSAAPRRCARGSVRRAS